MENEKVSALFAIVIRLSGSGFFAEYSESVPEEWFFAQFLSFVHTTETQYSSNLAHAHIRSADTITDILSHFYQRNNI